MAFTRFRIRADIVKAQAVEVAKILIGQISCVKTAEVPGASPVTLAGFLENIPGSRTDIKFRCRQVWPAFRQVRHTQGFGRACFGSRRRCHQPVVIAQSFQQSLVKFIARK